MLNNPSQIADILAGMRPKDVTPQLIVEVAVGFTLQQGYRCQLGGVGRYRLGSDRCAIGWLIPSRCYSVDKEGKSILSLCNSFLFFWRAKYRLPKYFYRHAVLLRVLQRWHDEQFHGVKRANLGWLQRALCHNGYFGVDLTFAYEMLHDIESASKAENDKQKITEKDLSPA